MHPPLPEAPAPDPSPPAPQSLKRRLRDALEWSLLVGGVAMGTGLSALHLRLNETERIAVALASWAWFALLYALLVAVPLVAVALVWPVARPWLVRGRAVRRRGRGGPGFSTLYGLRSFAVVYSLFGALYGLTYDQALVEPGGWVGMAFYLLAAALLVAGVAWILVPMVLRGVTRVGGSRVVLTVLLLGAVLHLGSPLLRSSPGTPSRSPEPVEVVPPGRPGTLPARHLVLLGLDGLDPHVVDRLVVEGRLPTFERLRSQGVYAQLGTLPDANSAVLWASIYSGTLPARHGIHDFYRIRLPGTGPGLFPVHRTWFKEMAGVLERVGLASREPVVRSDLQRFPLWEIVDRFGVSAGVIDGYLTSYPAVDLDSEESFMVAYGTDWLAAELESGNATVEEVPSFIQPVDLLERSRLPDGDDFEWQAQMTLEFLRAGRQPRFLNVYAHEPDALQHESWRGFEPWRYPGPVPAEDEGAMVAQHVAFDGFLAELTEAAAPGTVFVLVSDHGHSPTIVHALDTQHRHGPEGVVMLWGEGVVGGSELEDPLILDVVPTALALLGLPVPEDVDGRVWTEAFGGALDDLAGRGIESYEGMWPPPDPGRVRDERLRQRELEKLKRMGYVN